MTNQERAELTGMEKRAAKLAEEIVDFARPRMMTTQIPGLAQMLVAFAQNEIRKAAAE